jgi:hypothetical protein
MHHVGRMVASPEPCVVQGEAAREKGVKPLRCKGLILGSAGGREAAFYPTASHGRIKENLNALRSLRLCGEYVMVS